MIILGKIKITPQKIQAYAQKIISIFQINTIKAKILKIPEKVSSECSATEEKAEEVFTSYLEKMGLACWIEIITNFPKCMYYFGPFASGNEAQRYLSGYLEDLQEEKAQIVSVTIQRGTPKNRTIIETEMENYDVDLDSSTFVSSRLIV